jgi:hypothetical protein
MKTLFEAEGIFGKLHRGHLIQDFSGYRKLQMMAFEKRNGSGD